MITLVVGLAQSSSEVRVREYETCLLRNVENSYIDRIVIVKEEPGKRSTEVWDGNRKVSLICLGARATYADYIKIANELDDVVVIANADVYFDWSVCKLKVIPEKTLCAITRTDYFANLRSSDAWAFRPKIHVNGCAWNLGRSGCETAFCEQVRKQLGWELWNPCYEVCLVHLHCSGVYSAEHDRVIKYREAPCPQPVKIDRTTGRFVAMSDFER